jgi:gamma-glutamyltranspeptidase/glutathione hydrolase
MKNSLLVLLLLCNIGLLAQQKIDRANSMVACAHPLAAAAGATVLKQGGNAYDAITAAAFALSVVEPSMSGLGGRLQVIHSNSKGKIKGIDATTQVPASFIPATTNQEDGYTTIGVPGVVKGLIELHQSNGLLPLQQVMAPAIQYAKDGFQLLPDEADRLRSVKKDLQVFASTKKHFFVADTLPAGEDWLKQPALASTLASIANDKGESFYKGPLAASLIKQVKGGGGYLAWEDMLNYRAENSTLLRGTYRGFEIVTIGMPAYGAIVIEMLHLLAQTELKNCTEKEFLLIHAGVHQLAYEDRKFLKLDQEKLTRLEYAKKRWQNTIQSQQLIKDSASFQNGHTTHLVAADAAGNIISLTQSLGPTMGSKVAAEDGGFMLATTMGPYLGKMNPGERASSHIAPVLIFKDGKPFMSIGAAGGARIVPAIVQTISRVIDRNLKIEDALAAARVFQLPDKLLIENHTGIFWEDNATFTQLQKISMPFEVVKKPAQFGRVHATIASTTGKWIGAADPDWSGVAIGVTNY